jgi:SHS2 domain-containing protein
MSFEFFDHTGDIGVRLTAPTLAELFAAAAEAFTAAIAEPDAVRPLDAGRLELAGPELDLLLVDFLSELLYRFESAALLVRSADVDLRRDSGEWRLHADLKGEPFDAARHEIRVLLKAVTYHELYVRQAPQGWEAQIIFDI